VFILVAGSGPTKADVAACLAETSEVTWISFLSFSQLCHGIEGIAISG